VTAILDSRQLRAFCVLARTGSFTATARQLSLTQSAVSHAMKTLEHDIGCRLLDRSGQKATLTEAGEALLPSAEKIIREMTRVRQEIGRLSKWGRAHLSLGASTTACQYLIPAVLREFRESYPDCVITIQPGDGPASIELLRADRIDLAICLQPSREPQMEFRPLFVDELQFILSPLHPWAKTGKVVREEIGRQNYVLYDKASFTYQAIDRYFAAENILLNTSIELGSMEAIKELVKAGLGVSILAPWVAQKELTRRSLVALPLGKRKLRRHWGIVCRKGRRLNLPEETFIGLCKAFAQSVVRTPR
jgi:LysR family transcriptional regulator, low CO2-responsive transcriptional regulator